MALKLSQFASFLSRNEALDRVQKNIASAVDPIVKLLHSWKLALSSDGVLQYDGVDIATVDDLVAGSGFSIAGAGLTSSGVTVNVIGNADGSVTVNANDVQVGVLATDAQHGVRGGGTQHANAVAAGAAGFMTGADKTKLDGVEASAINALAGAGMTKTGSTLNVIANADGSIVANADDIQVGVINDTQHGTRGGGTTHANVVAAGAAGFMTGADKTKLNGIATGATAEVDASALAAGRVTLANQTLGTGTKTVDALVSSLDITADATLAAQNGQFHAKSNKTDAFAAYRAYGSSGAAKFSWGYANSATAAPFTTGAYISTAAGEVTRFLTASLVTCTISTGGVFDFVSNPTVGGVAVLNQTNVLSGITNKTFSSMTHSGTLALGTTTVSGTPNFSGAATLGGNPIAVTTSVAPTILGFHGNATPNAASTNYLRPWHYSTTVNTTEIQMVMPFAGTARNAYFKAATAAVGGTHTFTVRKNGVDQTITFTVSAGTATGNDTAHSFTFAAGDTISVKCVANVGVSTGFADAGFTLQVTQA